MTNAEAIEILRHIGGSYGDVSKYHTAVNMAISALEKQEGKKHGGLSKVDETRNKEIVDMFSGFSNDSLFVAYECAKCLRDYGVVVSKAWDTVTQQNAALNRAYMQGRQDEAEEWMERDEYELQRGY